MRSKEAFAYSRSTGYFCSVCSVNRPSKRIIQAPQPTKAREGGPGLATTHEGKRLWNVQVRSSYPYAHLTRSFSTHSRGLAQGSWRAIQRRRVMIAAQLFLDEREVSGRGDPGVALYGCDDDSGCDAASIKGRPKPRRKP